MQDSNRYDDAVTLLKALIATPSISREEEKAADLIFDFLTSNGVKDVNRRRNNVWAYNRWFDRRKPTILLNSHIDTVKPNPQYTRDPYSPDVADGKLYGLGSNDAGGGWWRWRSTFLTFTTRKNMANTSSLSSTPRQDFTRRVV